MKTISNGNVLGSLLSLAQDCCVHSLFFFFFNMYVFVYICLHYFSLFYLVPSSFHYTEQQHRSQQLSAPHVLEVALRAGDLAKSQFLTGGYGQQPDSHRDMFLDGSGVTKNLMP